MKQQMKTIVSESKQRVKKSTKELIEQLVQKDMKVAATGTLVQCMYCHPEPMRRR